MESSEIIEYLRNLDRYQEFILKFEYYYKVIEEVTDKILKNTSSDELNKQFVQNISFVGSIIYKYNKSDLAKRLYSLVELPINELYTERKISIIEKNSFENMLFLCYLDSGEKSKALIKSKIMVQEFFNNRKAIKKECKILDKCKKLDKPSYIWLIMSLKDLCSYSQSISVTIGESDSTSFFFYNKNIFECIQFSYLIPNTPTERLIRNIHHAVGPNEMTYCFISDTTSNAKRIIKIKNKIIVFFKYILSKILKYLWGYGERPGNIIKMSFILIIIFSVIYKYSKQLYENFNGEVTIVQDFLTSLYFSIVTFIAFGYGEYCPLSWLRIIVSLEALTGFFLMSAFLVALTRKYLR